MTSTHTSLLAGHSPLSLLLKLVVPAVISVGLCWILFKGDNFGDMIEVVRTKCDFGWIGLMVVAQLFSFVFRAMRWGLQLEGVGVKASFITLLYSIFGTYAVNLVFPRLGEVWRSGFIAHREKAQFGTVFGTMLADRFADMITALLFAVVTAIVGAGAITKFVAQYPEGYRHVMRMISSPLTWGTIVLVVAVIVVLIKRRSSNPVVTKVQGFIKELGGGFAAILKTPHMGRWLLWTVGLWGCYLGQMFLAFEAFPVTRAIVEANGTVPVLVCFTLGSIAMGVPSNGGIGPYQVAVIFALMLYCPAGLDEAGRDAFQLDAKAFANLILSVSTLVTVIVGLWAFVAIAISKRRSSQREQ